MHGRRAASVVWPTACPTPPHTHKPTHPHAQEEQKGTLDGELATVIASITLACKQIASLVSRSGISNLTGTEGGQNFSVSACPWRWWRALAYAHACHASVLPAAMHAHAWHAKGAGPPLFPAPLGLHRHRATTNTVHAGRGPEEAGRHLQRGVLQLPARQRSHGGLCCHVYTWKAGWCFISHSCCIS